MSARSFRIYGPRGVLEKPADGVPTHARAKRSRSAAVHVPITEIMSRDLTCAFPDLEVSVLIDLMVRERLGCVPIVDEEVHPIGIITKLDIVEQLGIPRDHPTVADVMMPLAITLDIGASVSQAATLMAGEDMHHVMIVHGRRLVGVVSTMDITRWLAENDRAAPC